MGNTQSGDQYIFGGAKNSTPPFSVTAPYYAGDETSLKIEIGSGSTQSMNIPGNQILTADTAAALRDDQYSQDLRRPDRGGRE